METKNAIVIDSDGYKAEYVLVDVDDEGTETPRYYTLKDGEELICEGTAEALSMQEPQWDGTAWTETAPPLEPDLELLRESKMRELSATANTAIAAGFDAVIPSTGEAAHFSLQETDQINLATALSAVQQGAAGFPYHADGQLCRLYPEEDIVAVTEAATKHKMYHTTYANHLFAWTKDAETATEIGGITYGAELPETLAAHMWEVLTAAEGTV